MLYKASLVFLFLLFVRQAISQSKQPIAKNQFSVFTTSVPENQGFSSENLGQIFPYVKRNGVNIHSLIIVRNNKIVLDAYFYPYRKDLQHDIASCTKSVTSLLIGIAIDKGFIRDENELVKIYFPEIESFSKNFQTLTIKDLLTMTSGLDCGSNNEETVLSGLFKASDWPTFIFNIPSTNTPGKQFSYCSCNFYLLAEILYRSSKLSPEEFADKYLFKPMEIKNFYWTKNNKGVNYGWGDLALKPYDMAKIGALLLNNGKWNGAQLISSDYMKKATSIQIEFRDKKGYGYGFWVDNDHSFNAVGRGGQRIHVDRLYKAIVVTTGGGYDWDEKGGLDELIGHAISFNAIPRDQIAFDSLNAKVIGAASINGALNIQNARTTQFEKLFNRVIVFGKNSMGISNVQLIAKKDIDTMFKVTSITGKTTYYSLSIGTKYHYYKDPVSNHVYAVRGYWKEPDNFEIDFNTLTKINRYLIDFLWKDNRHIVTIKEETQHVNDIVQNK